LHAFLTSPMRPTCPAHLILFHFITLIFGEVYVLWRSSLCSLLQPPAASSLLFVYVTHTHAHLNP
jgi:hypothetical protein